MSNEDLIQHYALIFYTLQQNNDENNFTCHYIYSYHSEPSRELRDMHIRKANEIKRFDLFPNKVHTYLWKMTNPVLLSQFDFDVVVEQFIDWCSKESGNVVD